MCVTHAPSGWVGVAIYLCTSEFAYTRARAMQISYRCDACETSVCKPFANIIRHCAERNQPYGAPPIAKKRYMRFTPSHKFPPLFLLHLTFFSFFLHTYTCCVFAPMAIQNDLRLQIHFGRFDVSIH